MRLRHGLVAIACVFAMACVTRATTVTVNLGTASQIFTETGIGDNGSGYAQWFITNGACSVSGGNTTCTLSGSFTGSTAGFTGGTYALVTTYNGAAPFSTAFGSGPTPLIGISQSPGSSYFQFQFLPSTSTITLDLDESGGSDYVIPMWNGSSFVNGYDLADVGTPACSGTPSLCDPFDVGETSGAIFQDTVDGQASFTLSTAVPTSATPEPSSLLLLGTGLLGLASLRRKLFAS
ncbi:MAG: PEP-CTERM sorting domain-containing protein [Candidatus Acidiferrales bacterium]